MHCEERALNVLEEMSGNNPFHCYHLSFVVLFLWCVVCTILTYTSTANADQEAAATNNSSGSNSKESVSTRSKLPIDPAHFSDKVDWGTFYDPQSIFCGQFDCYKILALDYETEPTTKDITRNYRALGRHWHPDKNKEKGAKERFVVSLFGYA